MNAQSTKMLAAETPDVIAREMALDREQRREERQALVAIPASDLATAPARTSFLPQSMGEAMQFADLMARSNFVPNHFRGKQGDCMAIVMVAARWGMDPFAVALKSYFVKDGSPPAYEAQLVNAVVNSSGVLSGRLTIEFEGEGEKLRCTVTGFLRADPNNPMVRTQSIARITTRNSPLWKADPEQQLAYYTTRAWARLYTPEVLMGVYTPDELDVDPERARVVSPPMPRRGELIDVADHDSDAVDVVDEQTDEVTTDNAKTVAEKPTLTDQQEFTKHPSEAIADDLISKFKRCELLADYNAANNQFNQHSRSMSDEIYTVVEAARLAASSRFDKITTR
jgi:RecT family